MRNFLRLMAITILATANLLTIGLAPVAASQSPTVVSLTFDDGLADQVAAAATANAAGLPSTYYINSGRIGTTATYMTQADLHNLANSGNEIAGHTVSHLNMAALTPDGQRRQICNDRNVLMGWGFSVKNFAYPFAAFNNDTLAIVAECGYNSARRVSDLASGSACQGCPVAESIPPANPYIIRTPDSIKVDTSLADLKGYVTQAEEGGGGWVPLVFHHVCNACDPNSITPSDFSAFVTWLAARGPNTTVQTVDQVIGGQLNPAPPITPVGPGTSELQNPDLELDVNADNEADCWQRAGFGTNTATFTRTGDAHSGSFAERIDMTSFTTGGRRLVVRQDDGACSPAISPGDRATLSAWYKSDVIVKMSVFYRDALDVWHPWNTSPAFPASVDWAQATYVTPALPSDAIGISWGLSILSEGSVTTDDYAMSVAIPDTIVPVVGLIAPDDGAAVSGHAVGLTAVADDETGVSKVDFLVNGAVVGTDLTSPYGFTWDSSSVPDGSATVQAMATDTSNNTALSDLRTVTVDNSTPVFGVVNPGLEDDVNGDNLPDCWQLAGSGNNSFSFNRTSDAHTGSFAERIDISSYTDGSRRLIVKQDAGQCAIPVVAGHPYTLSAWVKGSGTIRITAFWRDSAGSWIAIPATNGPTTPAQAAYTQLVWTTAAAPAGATFMSFGVTFQSAGSITVDDHAIVADTTAPTVALTAPTSGQALSGTVALNATASDNIGVAKVDFLADGVVVGTDTTAPYTFSWDSTTVADGPVTLAARATDTSDNVTTSAAVPVTVTNAGQGWGVRNASLEIDADSNSMPDCWQTSGSGTNTFAYTRTSDAHTGSFAEKIDITAYTSGARRLIQTQDAGACAIPVVPGNSYALSAWVKGSGTIRMTVFYRDSGTGLWTTIGSTNGPTQAAPAEWTLLTWTPAAIPAGVTHVSFGVTLQTLGSITVDDHAISGTPPPDTTFPTTNLTAPVAGSTHTGSTILSALANDDRGIATVEFLVDGNVVGSDTTSPYSFAWDSTTVPDGTVSITARATDTSTNATTSAARSITLDNTGPTVELTAPADAATVSGLTVTISATATDPAGVASVQFFAGATLIGTDSTAPYSISWDSTTVADGDYVITAQATDTRTNSATSAGRTITVDNVDTAPPTVSLTAPEDGATVSGTTVTVSADADDDIAVASVEFFAGATSLGTDTTSPYSITWDTTTAPNGSFSITAVATDSSGNDTTSAARTVTTDNPDITPPTVSLTAPADGATVTGAAVEISADADDNIAVASVEFFVDGLSVGSDLSSPYSITWDASGTVGTVSITAVATDTSAHQATSAPHSVNVTLTDTTPPTVSLTAPADGATVAGSAVVIAANAGDNVAVASVQFYVDGSPVGAPVTTAPYSVTWDTTSIADGTTVSITAVATDTNTLQTTSAPRSVTVDNTAPDTTPPTIDLTAPAEGSTVAGDAVVISADAFDNVAVASVQFYVDGSPVGAPVTTAPYSVTWDTTSIADGTTVSITAVATDTGTNATTSAVRSVTVDNTVPDTTPPTVDLTAPADGSTVSGAVVTISADAFDNVAVASVQFYVDGSPVGAPVTTAPYTVDWDSTGITTVTVVSITAVATDTSINATTSTAHSVTVDNTPPDITPPTVDLTAPADGSTVSGLAVGISADASDNVAVGQVEFFVENVSVGIDLTAPYSVTWDSSTTANGTSVSITAVATDTSTNATTSTARSVTVDNSVADITPPTVSLTAPAGGSFVSGAAVTISADADDNVAVQSVEFFCDGVSVGSDASAPYTTTWDTTTGANGPVSITAVATDTSNNPTTSVAHSVTVDNVPPSVALSAPADGANVMGTAVTLSATASDTSGIASVEFFVNGLSVGTDNLVPFTLPWDSTTAPDGSAPITAKATDNAGNSATSAARTVTIDNTAPTVAISQPAEGAIVFGPVNIFADVTDASVFRVEFLINGVVINTDSVGPSYDTTWDSTSGPDGPVTITARAADSAGNVTTSAPRNVTVHNAEIIPPTVALSAPANGAIVAGTAVVLSATASDASGIASVEFFVNGLSVGIDTNLSGGWSITWNSTTVVDGSKSITAKATDTATNTATTPARTVTVDNTGPVVSLTAPPNGAILTGSLVTLSATATDVPSGVTSVQFLVNDVVVATDTSSPWSKSWNPTTVPDGPISITARATDARGNITTSAARSATVAIPPSVSVTAPASNAKVGGHSVTISATAADNGTVASVQFLVRGVVVGTDTDAPFSISWDSTTVVDGSASITARATDAGSNSTTSSARTITVDNTAPTVSVSSPSAGATVSGSNVTISVSANDPSGVTSVQFLVNGVVIGTDTNASWSISWNSTSTPDGPISITAIATDAVGNSATSAPRSAIVKNDLTSPTVSLTAPASNAVVSGTDVTLSATASDNVAVASVAFLINGTVVGTDTSSPYSISWNSTTVSSGSVSLKARATDTVGNVTTTSGRTIRVDNTAPTVALTAPSSGATVAGTSVTISATANDNIAGTSVQFLVNDTVVGTDSSSPYSISWNSTSVSDGPVSITARATDGVGISTTSAARSATVLNAPPVIQNADLETDSGGLGMPDCWQTVFGGNNIPTYTRESDSHDGGSFAAKITLSSTHNGSAAFVVERDTNCGIQVVPGRRYTVGAWYKSSVSVRLTVSYRNSSGTWVSWGTSPTSGSSSAWRQITFTTASVPSGATHLSFGISISNNGNVTVDDHSISLVP